MEGMPSKLIIWTSFPGIFPRSWIAQNHTTRNIHEYQRYCQIGERDTGNCFQSFKQLSRYQRSYKTTRTTDHKRDYLSDGFQVHKNLICFFNCYIPDLWWIVAVRTNDHAGTAAFDHFPESRVRILISGSVWIKLFFAPEAVGIVF